MHKDNQIKYESGKNAKTLIEEMLNDLKDDFNLNIEIEKNYSIGYKNKVKQFKMDFLIRFLDFGNVHWLVKSTNTIRDRIYGTEFFAQNIKIIDSDVENIFVVVPDSISDAEMRNKNNYAAKVNSKTYKSFLDNVLTVNELRRLIIEKATQNISQGILSNLLGNDAEKGIVSLLNDTKNKELWNDYDQLRHTVKSSTFNIYKIILEKFGLIKGADSLLSVAATDNIPLLANRGNPKTDVFVKMETNNKIITKRISIKNTSKKVVTVHEGDASDLIYALNLGEKDKLSQALLDFESVGSKKNLSLQFPDSNDILEKELHKYNKKLVKFFIFGENSPLITDDMQIADTIIFTNKFEIWNKKSYINYYLNEYSDRGQFGTPFKWTYPSKRRGQKIQLKGFTNN